MCNDQLLVNNKYKNRLLSCPKHSKNTQFNKCSMGVWLKKDISGPLESNPDYSTLREYHTTRPKELALMRSPTVLRVCYRKRTISVYKPGPCVPSFTDSVVSAILLCLLYYYQQGDGVSLLSTGWWCASLLIRDDGAPIVINGMWVSSTPFVLCSLAP